MKLLKSIKHQTLQPGPKAMSFNRLSLSLSPSPSPGVQQALDTAIFEPSTHLVPSHQKIGYAAALGNPLAPSYRTIGFAAALGRIELEEIPRLFGGGNSIPTITNQKMCSVASVCAAAVCNQKQW